MPIDSDTKLRFYQQRERMNALEKRIRDLEKLWEMQDFVPKEKAPTPEESRPACRGCSDCAMGGSHSDYEKLYR